MMSLVLCFFFSLLLHNADYKCLHSRKHLWKEVVPTERSLSLMSMISHLKQKGLVPHQEYLIPTSLDPMLPFRLMRIISEMLHHYITGKTCWSIFTSWHWNFTMICSQGLKLSSFRSGWSLWEFGKRILCQCNCGRWRTQVLG